MRLRAHGPAGSLGTLAGLAERLAAARHSARPSVARPSIAVCAADHGASDEAERSASARAARAFATGKAPLNVLARGIGAQIHVVDAGLVAPVAGSASGPDVVDCRLGAGTADLRHGPAMTRDQAVRALDAGAALAKSLAGAGMDALGLSQVGAGGSLAAAVLTAALLGQPNDVVVVDALARNGLPVDAPSEPVAALAAVGGFELGVLAGLCLGASAQRAPLVVDGGVATSAVLLAARLAPPVVGYVFASRPGDDHTARTALAALELEPVLDLGLAAGAALVPAMSLLDSAARLLAEAPSRGLPVVG